MRWKRANRVSRKASGVRKWSKGKRGGRGSGEMKVRWQEVKDTGQGVNGKSARGREDGMGGRI